MAEQFITGEHGCRSAESCEKRGARATGRTGRPRKLAVKKKANEKFMGILISVCVKIWTYGGSVWRLRVGVVVSVKNERSGAWLLNPVRMRKASS